MRQYDGMTIDNIEVIDQFVHETANGSRLLVMQGNQFDPAVVSSPLLVPIGSRLCDSLLKLNRLVNWGRTKMGREHWSMAACLKQRVKKAVKFMANFEEAVRRAAESNKVDGLVCGHIHRPVISIDDNVICLNCGDWVESCTALIEHHDGTIELIRFSDVQEVVKRLPPRCKDSPTPDAAKAA